MPDNTREMEFVLISYRTVTLTVPTDTEVDDMPQNFFDTAIDKARDQPGTPDWEVDNWYFKEQE